MTSTPLGAVGRGALAGAAGTGVMTAWQGLAARAQGSGGDDSVLAQTDAERWEQAPAPAKVARKALRGMFDADIGADRIDLLTTVMHWGYGTAWGALYGVVAGSLRRPRPLRSGLLFGTAVWGASYAQLVPMGIYQPPWTYPPAELALDWSYHGAYGAGVGLAHGLLSR